MASRAKANAHPAAAATEKIGKRTGAHMSIAGGVEKAPQRAHEVGAQTMQIFTKNNTQWAAKPIEPRAAEQFKSSCATLGIQPVVVHDSYLINLGAPSAEVWERSREALVDELERAELLGLDCVILHPGAHLGKGEAWGLQRVAESINRIHARLPGGAAKLCLETTAGQGSNLGYRFEHLARLFELVEEAERLGVCIDTCHLFAAGYDIRTPPGWEATMREFAQVIGFDRLRAVHVNDSKSGFDSRVDRHAHLGKGAIGLEAFRCLMNDARFDGIPLILETPKSKDGHEDVENLAVLRRLVGDAAEA